MRHVWTVGLLAAVVAGVVLTAGGVGAQQELMSVTVTIPIDTVVTGDPGYTEVVATLTPADLDAELGWVCNLVGFGDNGESTRTGTNGIIASNGDVVIIPDWERTANTRTAATMGSLTLGESITIAIQVGPLKTASGGLEIQFTCSTPGTTTTTEPPTVTTAPTVPDVSTSSSIPIGVPSGIGPVDDGGFDVLWLAILLPAAALLAWAAFRYVLRSPE